MANTAKRLHDSGKEKEKMIGLKIKLPASLYAIIRSRAENGAFKTTPEKFITDILECEFQPGAEA